MPADTILEKQIRQHYQNRDIRSTILKYSDYENGFRALNGDDSWYVTNKNGFVRLSVPEDYDIIIDKHRSLYCTLDVFDTAVKQISSAWDQERKKPVDVIGTLADCQAYTLSVDIDSIGDIFTSSDVKQAVEDAGQFFVDYLKSYGLSKSVHVLYSGGGLYIHIHHKLTEVPETFTHEERSDHFHQITEAFNKLTNDISRKFFKKYPQHVGRVKFDALNNQKRKFKCIFSVHKRYAVIVIPLDPAKITIDFKKAWFPLSNEVIESGKKWYQIYDLEEKEALDNALLPYGSTKKYQEVELGSTYQISETPDKFAPCMRNIIERVAPGKGPHRALAALASYLYNVRMPEEEAFELWDKIASRVNVEPRIFDLWFGEMSCPNCSTIQTITAGYPKMGLGDFDYCQKDEGCKGCISPPWYGQGDESHRLAADLTVDNVKRMPGLPFEGKYLNALVDLRSSDEAGYENVIGRLKSAKCVSVKKLENKIRDLIKRDTTPNDITAPPEIVTKAEELLKQGKAFEYVLETWKKQHQGDENLGKALFLSMGAQSCQASKGIHIHACGPRGGGKSDGSEKAANLVPPEYMLVGSASPRALYYLGEKLLPGSIVYLDDIGWNDDSAMMFKTCTTFYRTGATHTIPDVKEGTVKQFKTAPRIIFWITSADAQADEQVRDRLLRIDVEEKQEHIKNVVKFIFLQRKEGISGFDDQEVEICREIIRRIKSMFKDVVIPFSEMIKFDGDPRGATIFADLVSAFTVWRSSIRHVDKNGALVADYDDYKDAATFFNAISGHNDSKFTPRELKVLQAIKDKGNAATREEIMGLTRLSKGDLSSIINGRGKDDQKKYGLLHKCPALTEDDENITTREGEYGKSISKRKKIYRLGEDFDLMNAYGKTVSISGDENTIRKQSLQVCIGLIEVCNCQSDSGKEKVCKFDAKDEVKDKNSSNSSNEVLNDGENNSRPGEKNDQTYKLSLPDIDAEIKPGSNQCKLSPADTDSQCKLSSESTIPSEKEYEFLQGQRVLFYRPHKKPDPEMEKIISQLPNIVKDEAECLIRYYYWDGHADPNHLNVLEISGDLYIEYDTLVYYLEGCGFEIWDNLDDDRTSIPKIVKTLLDLGDRFNDYYYSTWREEFRRGRRLICTSGIWNLRSLRGVTA